MINLDFSYYTVFKDCDVTKTLEILNLMDTKEL